MTVLRLGKFALLVSAIVISTGTIANAQSQGVGQSEFALASYCDGCNGGGCDSCDSGYSDCGGCNSCSSGSSGCDLLGGLGGSGGQIFFGADYIYARASFSQSVAFLETNTTDPTNFTNTFHQFDMDYESNYRLYGGYRDNCGCEVTFAYGRMGSTGTAQSGVAVPTGVVFYAPLETNADLAGEYIQARLSVDVKTYDLAFSKTIPLGSPLGCCDSGCGDTCGDSCGDCCDSCWCPAWDITWSAGLRFADVDWSRGSQVANTATGTPQVGSESRMSFSGGGLRTGLAGRRYLGKAGWISLFAKTDLSLLLGDKTIVTQRQSTQTGITTLETQRVDCTHIIPVLELEAGGTVHLTDCASVSAGYFFSAWHDLGMSEEYAYATPLSAVSYDDANILGFDGFFIRGELAF